MSKSLFASKTFWVNVIALVLSALDNAYFGTMVPSEYKVTIIGVLNLVLRVMTRSDGASSGTAGKLASVVLAIGVLLSSVGCASTTRSQMQTSAMVTSEAVLAIDTAEMDAYRAGVYSKDVHDKAGVIVLRMLRSDRAYLRMVRALPEHPPASALEAIDVVLAEVKSAGEDLSALMRDIPGASGVLSKCQVWLSRYGLVLIGARVVYPDPVRADMSWASVLMLLLKMVGDGRLSVAKIKDWISREGATDDEMAAMDAELTARIEARKIEHGVE